jgi:hypothetical protein
MWIIVADNQGLQFFRKLQPLSPPITSIRRNQRR